MCCEDVDWIYLNDGTLCRCGPGSSVGIATGYGLDGPGIESRWRTRFSAPVQTGPGAHPAFCTMVTGSLPGVKSGRGVTPTPHPLLVPWSRKSRTIPLLPLLAVRPVRSLSACSTMHFTYLFLHYADGSGKIVTYYAVCSVVQADKIDKHYCFE